MKRIMTSLWSVLMVVAGCVFAECCCQQQKDYSFYIKVDSGISFSEAAHVFASPTTWNPAIQGYNSKLGNQAIGGLSIGCEWMQLIDFEAGISARSTFKYRKFQTPVKGGDSYKREFDLDP